MEEEKSSKKADKIIVEISFELMKILDSVKEYVDKISYGSIKPSTYEASKLLAKKINQKGNIL